MPDAFDDFLDGYITAALWSSTDDDGSPLDDRHDRDSIAPETLAKMIEDCRAFYDANRDDIDAGPNVDHGCTDAEYAGHDFWLTRCGHGVGFWDGDWPEGAAERLTDAAHAMGNVDLYVGDDARVCA